jgi:amidase
MGVINMQDPKLNKLSDWLEEASINTIQASMSSGDITSKELIWMYLNRIATYDKQGISINSILEINPDALQIAEALDAERVKSGPRGPLHGIPVILKDNIDTADKMHTSAGSLALANSFAPEDSFIATLLRKAGAVILGKANMTEWANFMTLDMPTGYSSRGGQVLNPYGPGEFIVGGSSSGSGAAVSSNFTALAIGTETSGSILSPASQNSIVGIKPTVGLISRSGVIPIAHSQDTAGPMARTVTDAALLLGVLIGTDEKDPVTMANPDPSLTDYTSFLDPNGLKGVRIGIPRDFYSGLSEEKLALMNNAIENLKREGAVIIDPVVIHSASTKWDYNVLKYEFKSDLNAYLHRLHPNVPVHSLKEVIEFNNKNKEATLKYDQKLLIESEETSGTLTESAYITSRESDLYLSQTAGIDSVMNEHKLDALLFANNYGAGIPAKAGYPSITVPGGYTPAGEPVGVTFSGIAYSEPILIKLAYAYEQATKHRVAPKLY